MPSCVSRWESPCHGDRVCVTYRVTRADRDFTYGKPSFLDRHFRRTIGNVLPIYYLSPGSSSKSNGGGGIGKNALMTSGSSPYCKSSSWIATRANPFYIFTSDSGRMSSHSVSRACHRACHGERVRVTYENRHHADTVSRLTKQPPPPHPPRCRCQLFQIRVSRRVTTTRWTGMDWFVDFSNRRC